MKILGLDAPFRQAIRQVIVFGNLVCFEERYLDGKELICTLQARVSGDFPAICC